MSTKTKPQAYVRPDDGVLFVLNEDGKTYSMRHHLIPFKDCVHAKWSESDMKASRFVSIDDLTRPLRVACEFSDMVAQTQGSGFGDDED